MLESIVHTLTEHFGLLKTLLIAGLSSVAGLFAAEYTVLMFQVDAETAIKAGASVPAWYEHPAVIAAIVTAVLVIVGKILDRFWIKSDKKSESEDKFFERFQQLTQAERENVMKRMEDLQDDTAKFFRDQLDFKDAQLLLKDREIETMKAAETNLRVRTHVYGNYIDSLHNYIRISREELRKANVEPPVFQLKYHDDLMAETVRQIEEQRRIHETNQSGE